MSDDNQNQNQDQEIDFNNPKIQEYVEQEVKGLKAKNTELLGKLDGLKEFKSKFDGVDVDSIISLAEKAKQDELTKKLAEGKFDEVLAQKTDLMRQDLESKLSASQSRAQSLEGKVLKGQIAAAAAQAGVQAEVIDVVSMLAESAFKLDENYEPVAVNEHGEVINGKDGKTPLSIADWLASLRESKPIFWGTPQGSGSIGSKGGHQNLKRGSMTADQKAEYIKTHGQQAFLQLPK